MSRLRLFPLVIATTFLAFTSPALYAQQKFDVTPLNIGIHVIQAEVATKDKERQQGLMFRESMGPNEGMIFVFDMPTIKVCMWMKNTLIPLSVAFLDEHGKIVNIENMKPQTTDSHCSKESKPVRFALEMNQGWFKQKNIKPGSTVQGLPQIK